MHNEWKSMTSFHVLSLHSKILISYFLYKEMFFVLIQHNSQFCMIAPYGHQLSTLRTSTVKIKGLKMMTGLAVGLFSLVQHPLRFQIIALFGLDLELKKKKDTQNI